VYKKYIKVNGKSYGPYLYHNKRVGGKVITTYAGKTKSVFKKRKISFLSYAIISVLILLAIIGLTINYRIITSNVILSPAQDSNSVYVSFADPTPADDSTQQSSSIFVNLPSVSAGEHYSFVDFDRDLKLWLRMDDVDGSGNPLDSSSYGNNGNKQGTAAQDSSGRFGKSFAFNGNGDFISIPDSTSLNFANGDPITISVWFKTSSSAGGPTLLSKGRFQNDADANYAIDIGSDSIIRFYYLSNTGWEEYHTTGLTIADNNWHNFVVRYKFGAGNSIKTFYDGASTSGYWAVGTGSNAPVSTSDPLIIGALSPTYGMFTGSIDDTLIFNRVLSNEEINSLYSASTTQYSNNFIELNAAAHTIKGYASDVFGNKNNTEQRRITLATNNSSLNNTSANEPNISPENTPLEDNSDKSLQFWLRMDDLDASGSPLDSSSYSNNGASMNGAFQNIEGRFNSSFQFDGVDDYLILNKAITPLNSSDNFTISLWFNSGTQTSNNFGTLFFAGNKGAANSFITALFISNNNIYFRVCKENIDCKDTDAQPIAKGEWYHVVGVYSAKNMSIYLDNAMKSNVLSNLDVKTSSSMKTYLGAYSSEGLYYNGSIDEVMFFNRSLINSEIHNLYAHSCMNGLPAKENYDCPEQCINGQCQDIIPQTKSVDSLFVANSETRLSPEQTAKSTESTFEESKLCGIYARTSPTNAFASSTFTGYPAKNAIDNDVDTNWYGKYEQYPKWILFDLGSKKCVRAVDLYSAKWDLPMTFDVQISNDGANWDGVLHNHEMKTPRLIGLILPKVAVTRYVRVIETSGKRLFGGLQEFKVLAADYKTAPPAEQNSSELNESNLAESFFSNQSSLNSNSANSNNTNNNAGASNTANLSPSDEGSSSPNVEIQEPVYNSSESNSLENNTSSRTVMNTTQLRVINQNNSNLSANLAPLILNLSKKIYVCEGNSLNNEFSISNLDNDALTAFISPVDYFFMKPSFLPRNSSSYKTAITSEILTKNQIGSYAKVVSITDGIYADYSSVNLTVIEINNIPSIEAVKTQTISLHENPNFYKQINVKDIEDLDQNSGNFIFNLTFLNHAKLFGITNKGIISFTADSGQIGVFNLKLCVTDKGIKNIHPNISLCGQDGKPATICQNFSLTITNENSPPVISSHFPANLNFNVAGAVALFNASFYDPDGTKPDAYWYVDDVLEKYISGASSGNIALAIDCAKSPARKIKLEITDGLLNNSIEWSPAFQSSYCNAVNNRSAKSCIPSWNCGNWGVCQNAKKEYDLGELKENEFSFVTKVCRINNATSEECGFQKKVCKDLNACGLTLNKPDEVRACQFLKNNLCSDEIKNCHEGLCEEGIDCGGPCEKECSTSGFINSITTEIKNITNSEVLSFKLGYLIAMVIILVCFVFIIIKIISIRRLMKQNQTTEQSAESTPDLQLS